MSSSILDSVRCLEVKLELNNVEHTVDIIQELQLGDAKHDPFAMLDLMDKAPAVLAVWGVALKDAKAEIGEVSRVKKQTAAMLKEELKKSIKEERGKAPPAAEVENVFTTLVADAPRLGNTLAQKYKQLEQEEGNWRSTADKLDTIVEACRVQCSMIRSAANLMQTLIQQNLITIPPPGAPQKPRPPSPSDLEPYAQDEGG